jgi:tetratricopeptide (TPR) repeat protein
MRSISLGAAALLASVLLLSGQSTRPSASARAANNRGAALMTQQNFQLALREFEAAAGADPQFTTAVVNQGIALAALGRTDAARRAFESALQLDPDSKRAHYNLGLLNRSDGKADEALREFAAVQRLDPNDAFSFYFAATIQFQQGDYAAAAANYSKAIEFDPAFVSAYFGASRSYTALQQPERARVYQDRFQTLTRDSSLNATIGTQYGEQGPYALAEEVDLPSAAPASNIAVRFTDGTRTFGTLASSDTACIIDFDRDGVDDLFIGDSIFRNRGRGQPRFAKAATLKPAVACAAGDFDNDEYTDLFIATAGAGVLYHNVKGQLVEDRNTSFPSAAAVAFVDLDHDGWLDLVIGSNAFRNKADGTFSPVVLPALTQPVAIKPTDYDNDRDIDLIVTSRVDSAVIVSNNRDGSFTRKDIVPELSRGSVTPVVFDFDKDGWMDLFLTRTDRPPLLLRNAAAQRFTAIELPGMAGVVADRGAAALDYDNDGFVDVAFVEPSPGASRRPLPEGEVGFRVRLLRNVGSGRFEDVTTQTGIGGVALRDPRNLLALDFDDDGDLDLIVTQSNAAPVLIRNDGGNRNGSTKVTLTGFKDNKSAIGTKVEVHGDGLRQKIEVTTPGAVLFGIGRSRVDFVRMLWPMGVVQDELPGNKTRVAYRELDRKGSSCPTLYTWDGKTFRFITDIIGPGVIGEWEAPGQWNASDTDEYVRLNPEDLIQLDGKYRIKILSQMEEVTYLDALKLVAVDTPADIDIFPNDRYQPIPPYSEFKIWQVRGVRPPISVVDERGRDLSKHVAEIDRDYAPVPRIENYPGYADPHSVIIDVGPIPPDGRAQLVLHGYTDYFDSTTAHSAYYSKIEAIVPYIEVADGKGGWIRKSDSIGLPAGLPKTIVVDISGMFPSNDHRVRITNSMEIYWDRILVNTFGGDAPIRITTVNPDRATIEFAGYPLELRKHPEDYDYSRRSRSDAFRTHIGNYTRYGDVTALMKSTDDMFAVMASGDGVTAEFDAGRFPEVPRGWHRTFLVHADGYEKAMETYTPFPNTVEPLPFHGMSRFPYPMSETYPDDPDHLRYRLEYNTRHIGPSVPTRPVYRRSEKYE